MTNLYRASQYVAWGAMILLLPITSLEILARWTGASTVALPSAIPLLWLVLAWFVPYLFRGGAIPRQALPFLAFAAVALIATLASYFLDVPPFKQASTLSEQSEALLTLGVGAAFYLVASTWPRSTERLQLSLKLINWTGALLIVWCLVQAYFILFQGSRYPGLVIKIQDLLSQRELFIGRVTGFAFEPSWLAHQLNVLFIPFWLAASAARFSAHRRFAGLSVENVLLVLGFGMLFLSFSRIGILAMLLMVSFLILPLAYRAGRAALSRAVGGFNSLKQPIRAGLNLGLVLVVAAGYLAGVVGLVYAISRFDPRLAALFENLQWDGNGIYSLANQLAFAERLVYWATGWFIFNDFPALGVGLGNAGFFFPQKMPAFGWALWEVNQIFFRLSQLPNPKSMWARILAETGWAGFSVFITWLYVLWRSAKTLSASASPLLKTVALAGMLSLVVYLVEGFSLDSFAIPYLWLTAGLLTAGVGASMDGEEIT